MTHDPFAVAHQLAPAPTADATADELERFYAAQAFAAFAVLHHEIRNLLANPELGSRPDIGWLSLLATTSLHAARMLGEDPGGVPVPLAQALWDLTPGYGQDGAADEWLTAALDRLGINPADIDPRYEAGDFRSPSRLAEVAR